MHPALDDVALWIGPPQRVVYPVDELLLRNFHQFFRLLIRHAPHERTERICQLLENRRIIISESIY